MPKKVAVIGAGICGLIAIKTCKDEGLEVECFEVSTDFGGLWRYTEEKEEKGCVMKSTIINTSKEAMAFSDFPPPEDNPNYMHNTKLLEYFKMYVKQFDVEKHIKYRHKVEQTKPADDYEQTGRWHVTVRNLGTGDVTDHVYDGVLVCTGHHADKHVPNFEGLVDFKGRVIHSKEYKKPTGYEDKRVLVVGLGNSGGDVAVELSRTAKQVYLAVRTGTYCMNRVSKNGWPMDSVWLTRALVTLFANEYLPGFLRHPITRFILNERMDHRMYGLLPKHEPFENHPLVNDSLPTCLLSGTVILKPNVRRFYEGGVEFQDGSRADLDAVILATGYTFGFPFLDSSIVEVKANHVQLYKYMYPPHLKHPTLAVIGCFQVIGALNPVAEMQCRLATRIIKGETNLPEVSAVWDDIRANASAMSKKYYSSLRHTIQLDIIPYMDELAELIGCRPTFGKMWKIDPRLAFKWCFGMWTPYQYRLFGPGQWKGALQAYKTQEERIQKPLRTRLPDRQDDRWSPLVKVVVALVVVIVAAFLF